MSQFLAFTIIGLIAGSAYAIAASGLVLTYATSNVFNIAHGAIGMFMAFVYWSWRSTAAGRRCSRWCSSSASCAAVRAC
jgi:branched-subunit amino acid ABC-type transport system permease component